MMHAFAELVGNELPLAIVVRITIVLAVAWTCDAALRRANPRWRIFAWRATAVGIVVVAAMSCRPPAITLALLPTGPAAIKNVETAEPSSSSLPLGVAVSNPSADGPLLINPPALPSANIAKQDSPPIVEGEKPGASGKTSPPATTNNAIASAPASRTARASTSAWIVVIWAAGAVAVLARFFLGARRVARLVVEAPPAPAAICEQAAAMAARCGASSPVDVRQSSAAIAPCSAGILRPVILLPASLCHGGCAAAVQGTLAHELAHVAGRDLLWNAALELFAALLWFHPLAWRMRVAHVDACDERCDAVATSVTADADGYGRLLAQVALQVAGGVPAVALPMARTPQVLRRIGLLSSGRGVATLSRRRAVVVALLGASLAGTLGLLSVGRREAVAAPAAPQTAQASKATDSEIEDTDDKKTPRPHLSGRITDDTGAPVTDAEVSISGNKQTSDRLTNYFQTKTDAEGRYAFDDVTVDDTYRLRVESTGWVGITDSRLSPQLQLTSGSAVTQDLILTRACRIRIRTVDEAGKPITEVNIYSKRLGDDQHRFTGSVRTDQEGWAEIGGLAPSTTDYVFGASHDDFAFGKLTKRLNDPATVPEEKIVLVKGQPVVGLALCSDKKPATGWTINAMPDWWIFGVTPRGAEIGKAGEFLLPHVATGAYDITVNVPEGGGLSRSVPVAAGKKLPLPRGVLEVALSIPSPQSMVEIAGVVKLSGDTPQQSIFIEAASEDRRYHGSGYVNPGETEFRIKSLNPGIYTLRVNSTEIEEVVVPNVKAPSEGLEIEVNVVGKPLLRGRVLDDSGQAVTSYRVRVVKVGYTRGPNYVQDSHWQSVENSAGEFSVPLVGPGVYQATVAADGWAASRSESMNTDELPKEPLTVRLTRGVTLRGTVVDEAGRPIDGATVGPRSASAVASSRARGGFSGNEGAVKTVDGKFTLMNQSAGPELLRITHPDYCFAFSDEITVAEGDVDVAPITLTRGGTVRGTVYDSAGEPRPNVEMMFNDTYGYGGGDEERAGRFATVVTDADGNYEAHHLPAQLCYVHLAEEWEQTGVVRSAILPANGEVRTLDFGGQRGVSGRALVNGKPLANARLQLGGDNPHFGVFKDYTQTDRDGRFTFGRPPAGGRVLWLQPGDRRSNWVRLAAVDVTDETTDLGDVRVQSGTVSIAATGLSAADLSGLHVTLLERNPTWVFASNDTGVQEPRAAADQPFVFKHVPAQKLDVLLRRQDGVALRQEIDVAGGDQLQEITVAWPAETGTLVVEMPAEFRESVKFSPPQLRSVDGRIYGYLHDRHGKGITLANLPTGDYYLTDQGVRNASHVLDFKIAPGETTTLDVNESTYAPAIQRLGMARIRWFGEEGIPLTGVNVDVRGTDDGRISYVTAKDEGWSIAAEPGEYLLTASFPGYVPIEKTITVVAPNASGQIEGEITTDVYLSPVSGEAQGR